MPPDNVFVGYLLTDAAGRISHASNHKKIIEIVRQSQGYRLFFFRARGIINQSQAYLTKKAPLVNFVHGRTPNVPVEKFPQGDGQL
jgi:hypothetical protein